MKEQAMKEQALNRIVIYGTRLTGAYQLGEELWEYLNMSGVKGLQITTARYIEYIDNAFFGKKFRDGIEVQSFPKIPRGVVVFPQMRYYDHGIGRNISILKGDVIYNYIQELCQRHTVPIMVITDPQQIRLDQLLGSLKLV